MIVVSDTSPITSLLAIHRLGLLHALFDTVLIPPAVERELLAYHDELPGFIRVEPALDAATLARLRPWLDEGEAEAIALAKRQQPEWLLMDETRGRAIAEREGIRVIGLVGTLVIAKRHGLIESVAEILDALEQEAGFFLSKQVRADVLRSAGRVVAISTGSGLRCYDRLVSSAARSSRLSAHLQ